MENKVEMKMPDDDSSSKCSNQKGGGMADNGVSGGIYGLAFIGALVYYIEHAANFWAGVIGVFKAVLWPAFIMYRVLELLKM